jgi:hypothetical protein
MNTRWVKKQLLLTEVDISLSIDDIDAPTFTSIEGYPTERGKAVGHTASSREQRRRLYLLVSYFSQRLEERWAFSLSGDCRLPK